MEVCYELVDYVEMVVGCDEDVGFGLCCCEWVVGFVG